MEFPGLGKTEAMSLTANVMSAQTYLSVELHLTKRPCQRDLQWSSVWETGSDGDHGNA